MLDGQVMTQAEIASCRDKLKDGVQSQFVAVGVVGILVAFIILSGAVAVCSSPFESSL